MNYEHPELEKRQFTFTLHVVSLITAEEDIAHVFGEIWIPQDCHQKENYVMMHKGTYVDGILRMDDHRIVAATVTIGAVLDPLSDPMKPSVRAKN